MPEQAKVAVVQRQSVLKRCLREVKLYRHGFDSLQQHKVVGKILAAPLQCRIIKGVDCGKSQTKKNASSKPRSPGYPVANRSPSLSLSTSFWWDNAGGRCWRKQTSWWKDQTKFSFFSNATRLISLMLVPMHVIRSLVIKLLSKGQVMLLTHVLMITKEKATLVQIKLRWENMWERLA